MKKKLIVNAIIAIIAAALATGQAKANVYLPIAQTNPETYNTDGTYTTPNRTGTYTSGCIATFDCDSTGTTPDDYNPRIDEVLKEADIDGSDVGFEFNLIDKGLGWHYCESDTCRTFVTTQASDHKWYYAVSINGKTEIGKLDQKPTYATITDDGAYTVAIVQTGMIVYEITGQL